MEFFDQIFYKVLIYYKERLGKGHHKKALSIALGYVSVLEISIVFLLGILIFKLVGRNHSLPLTSANVWMLFALVAIGIYLFNVLQYNGRRRMKIKSRMIGSHKKTTQIAIYWIVPLAIVALSIILLQAF